MTFELKVYSRRQKRSLNYRIEKTENGWNVKYLHTRFDNDICDKKGAPNLYKQLNQDSINYPDDLGNYMEYLWNQATEEHFTNENLQEHLNELGEWISTVEKASPKGTFWEGYN